MTPYTDPYGRLIPQAPAPQPDFFNSDTYKTMKDLMPGYQSLRNPDGSLKSQFQLSGQPDVGFTSNLDALKQQLSGINLNKAPLQQLEAEGMRAPGTASPWATMALGQAKSAAGAQGATALSSGMSALATHGGVNKGARERMATGGARNTQMLQQKAGMDIGIQDENNRQNILSQLPGQEIAALQPELQKTTMWSNLADQEANRKQGLDLANRDYTTGINKANIGTAIGDVQGQQGFDMSKYQEIMKAWAADKTATAQQNAGK